MADFWKLIAEFNPKTADPHFCWALLRMEEERYIRIKNGKIIPTGKVMKVSPQTILDRPAPLWECNVAKSALVMEAEGQLRIENGVLQLTEKGKAEAMKVLNEKETDKS
jgi:hypothetical protein